MCAEKAGNCLPFITRVKLDHFSFTKTEIQNEVVIVMNFDVPNNALKKYKAQTIRYTGRTDKKNSISVKLCQIQKATGVIYK